MNALTLAEKLIEAEKTLKEMQDSRASQLEAANDSRFSEWAQEHAADSANMLRGQIETQMLLIKGIRATLKGTPIND
jgi:hypothetical protein